VPGEGRARRGLRAERERSGSLTAVEGGNRREETEQRALRLKEQQAQAAERSAVRCALGGRDVYVRCVQG